MSGLPSLERDRAGRTRARRWRAAVPGALAVVLAAGVAVLAAPAAAGPPPADDTTSTETAGAETAVAEGAVAELESAAWIRQARLYVSNRIASRPADYSFAFGRPRDAVTTGDWNGDGRSGFAARSGNVFTLVDELGLAQGTAAYGKARDDVFVGDWDGDGVDTFGVRRGNVFFLRNRPTTGRAHVVLGYGKVGDEVFVGDFDGDGLDTFAVRRGNLFYVRNSTTTGRADIVFGFGRPGDEVLVGDWDHDGRDTFAVRRGNVVYIRDNFRSGPAQRTIGYGRPTDQLLVGDFDGDGVDTFTARRVETVLAPEPGGPFATTGPLTLLLPSSTVTLVGFHESGHDGAQQMDEVETVVPTVTMETRFRGTGSRSAADIVVEPDTAIWAPVTGTVQRAGTYQLYCQYSDDFVWIEPDDRPGWQVKLLHIDGVTVEAGDRVEAGVTVLAPRATQLPFESQIDELTPPPHWPHVHIEVVDLSINDTTTPECATGEAMVNEP